MQFIFVRKITSVHWITGDNRIFGCWLAGANWIWKNAREEKTATAAPLALNICKKVLWPKPLSGFHSSACFFLVSMGAFFCLHVLCDDAAGVSMATITLLVEPPLPLLSCLGLDAIACTEDIHSIYLAHCGQRTPSSSLNDSKICSPTNSMAFVFSLFFFCLLAGCRFHRWVKKKEWSRLFNRIESVHHMHGAYTQWP